MDKIKRLGLLVACAAMVFCSCGKDERIYTEDELNMIVEWSRAGWTEVINKTDGAVTLITEYPDYCHVKELTSVLQKGDTVKLDWGAQAPGVSILECTKATVKLSDGSEIVCDWDAKNPWSKRFFEHGDPRFEYEVVEFNGKKVRHNLTVYTFFIDNDLVDIWRNEKMSGRWDPIALDKEEVHFPKEGGEETVTVLNYPSWWINFGYDYGEVGPGGGSLYGYVRATSTVGKDGPTDLLEGEWYHAIVPDRCESSKLIITVTPNDTGSPREATIEMESEGAFKRVKISQD